MMAHTREAVRVKVKKCEQNRIPEWRKFSVDPQITSLEVLYSLLAKAFDIKCDFSIKYKAFDPAGNEIYLAVLSDWDLDAAFLRIHNISIQTSTEPCLTLQIDIKPFTEVKEWDCETPSSSTGTIANTVAGMGVTGAGAMSARELMSPLQQSQKYMQHMQTKLPGLIMNQMEKTFSIVQKAFNLSDETMASLPPRAPLSDGEFRLFLDALGQIQRTDELRKVIFFGGIDPSLRRVVWKHILNVYPGGMNGQQRLNFMRRKSEQYYTLRETWKTAIKQGCVAGELAYVTGMVKKDVLRTDRLHPFYAGSDDNQNIASLFNILTTYALNHPAVNYCQGMSDIASPLLVTMNDEAQAYICFCAIMARVRGNFMIDGIAMTQKFSHLTEALSFYDPEFWDYLKAQQADDLLFCYRWLLLEMKREFPFEDALRMLEVQWSSLKYETNADIELSLYEKEFVPSMDDAALQSSVAPLTGDFGPPPISPSYLSLAKPRENPYTKVCALRRQSSLASLSSLGSSGTQGAAAHGVSPLNTSKRLNQSLDDNMSRHANRRRHRNSSGKAHQSLDETRMLQLIENIDPMEGESDDSKKLNQPSGDTVNLEDTDDEVFTSDKTSGSHNPDDSFNFHPTNPFKDDAELKASSGNDDNEKANACPQMVPSVFRESSTSSPPADTDSLMGNLSMAGQIPKSIAKLHNKNILSNYNAVSNIIAKQLANASNVGGGSSGGGGHFRDLKEKIAASSRKGLSFDENSAGSERTQQQKLVKNFNEFLNFATNKKNSLADKLSTTTASQPSTNASIGTQTKATAPFQAPQSISTSKLSTAAAYPLLQVSKSALGSSLDDDSDDESSSVPETTWSGSTAATAIQQTNNWSMNSLQLDLNSLSSATHTPDRTPIAERKLEVDGNQTLLGQNDGNPLAANDLNTTPDDSQDQDQEYYPMTTAITRELRLESENLDRQVFGMPNHEVSDELRTPKDTGCREIEYEKLGKESLDLVDDLKENEIRVLPDVSELLRRRRNRMAAHDTSASVSSSSTTTTTSSNVNSNRETSWYNSYVDDEESSAEVTVHQPTDNNLNVNETQRAPPVRNVIVNINGPTKSTNPPTLRTISLDASTGAPTSALASATVASKLNPFIDDTHYDDGMRIPTSNSLPEVLVPISTDTNDASPIELATNASDEIAFSKSPQKLNSPAIRNGLTTAPILPPPTEFGGGNPFLMFLCLTLLLQHRNTIMKTGMDYNEIAMHFDKMVRKHDVTRVLNQARRMYIDYLKMQNAYKQQQQQQQASGDINRNSSNALQANIEQQRNNTMMTTTMTTHTSSIANS